MAGGRGPGRGKQWGAGGRGPGRGKQWGTGGGRERNEGPELGVPRQRTCKGDTNVSSKGDGLYDEGVRKVVVEESLGEGLERRIGV